MQLDGSYDEVQIFLFCSSHLKLNSFIIAGREDKDNLWSGFGIIFQFPEIAKARLAFSEGRTQSLDFRLAQLENMEKMLDDEDNRQMICEALQKDLRRSKFEATLTEVIGVKVEIRTLIKLFREMAMPEKLCKNILMFQDRSMIQRQPHGCTLIIAPWNYPLYLSLGPMAGAIAAGNTVILKPSEVSSYSSVVIAKLVTQYLDNRCFHVVLGGVERTQKLLQHKFDHIFFTGSPSIGKLILQAAAPHLTSCTLELGGKSPTYIHDTADNDMTVRRIIWGKMMNVGQTCIAPDYILCSKKVQASFIQLAKRVIEEFYGQNPQQNKDLARIININHFRRLQKLLNSTKGRIALGGMMDEKDLWVDFTIVTDIREDDPLMQEEIFGPLLPIFEVNSPEEAIKFINAREKPLALYVFSKNDDVAKKIVKSTSSGSVCINDCILQCGDLRLPFGGTGNSGQGSCHGRFSIEAFSYKRAIMKRELNFVSEKGMSIRYPPLTDTKLKTFEKFMMINDKFELNFSPHLTHFIALLVGYFICRCISYFT